MSWRTKVVKLHIRDIPSHKYSLYTTPKPTTIACELTAVSWVADKNATHQTIDAKIRYTNIKI